MTISHLCLVIALLASGAIKAFVGLVVFVLVLLLFLLWAIWDAVHISRRNQDYVLKPFNRWYLYLAAALLVGLFVSPHLMAFSPVQSFRIPSGSMEPAVRIGDHVYGEMNYYRSAKPMRGDLAVYISPDNPDVLKIGRVIGLEGEQIEIRNKMVYIDGQRLTDPWGYYREPPGAHGAMLPETMPHLRRRDNFGPMELPVDSVFILGDNRDSSYDSRVFGPVPLSTLQGRLLYVYWATDLARIGTSLR